MDDVAARCSRPGARGQVDAPAIELDRVTLTRGGRNVLADVSFAIAQGEFIGVFGPNGSGKTTLLQAILGLIRPSRGVLSVFGEGARRGTAAAGYLPQQRSPVADLRLCGWDFVASACNGERWGLPLLGAAGRREVHAAVELVGAAALAERPLSELSGGELQRLLLAQSLLGKPKLLLLDEPLISLDPHFQQAVVELVKRIQSSLGITVLFTAHDINPLLGFMDRVLYLGHGQAALGTVEEVINGEVLSRLYSTPIEVLRVKDRILVVSGHGPVETHAHLHDV
ncbi:MAG TPA: ATP-binding cassette domain-containing protein [Alphaproteobacteria bacterium]|nr:ATP-binding cassette domain-containing protein [Alphaproteobacteria bacterium]